MSVGDAHHGTPALAVADPRGLAVRAVQYHRRQAADPVERRVTHQRFDAAGRPVASRDPYLFALAQEDEAVPANLRQVFSLSGAPLSSDSVDAGWRGALPGAAGQGIETWDGRGSHSVTEFDELLRPVAVHERGEDVAEHVLERFSYAGVDADIASHNLCGQLIRHDDPAGSLHLRELGITGALLQQTRHFLLATDPVNWPDSMVARDALLEPGEGATTSHGYAPTTELLRQIDALGHLQGFAYTVAGELQHTRLTLAGDDPQEQTLVSELHYSASGQIESETAGNGVITRHLYDPADGRLIVLSTHKSNGTPLQNLKYRYDAVGNVQDLEDTAQPIRYFNNQRIEPIKNYCYDTLYQLIKATGWEAKTGHGGPALPDLQPLPLDPNQVAQYTQTFHYDAGGNLLDLVHVGAQAHGRTLTRARYSNRCLPERNGRPPTEAELAAGFDGNGNLRELQAGQSMDWDLRNQLSTVRPVIRADGNDDYEHYLYDGSGQRVRKLRATRTNTRTLISDVRYLPGVEIRSHSGTGEVLHVITASAGSNSVQVLHWATKPPEDITNDQVRYSLNDHLKSSTLELDQNADLISQEWYYPYGGTACFATRSAIEAKYKTVRYSGKERDATGLYYYGLRYYAPWLQRWINPDPAGNVDGPNRYYFVQNSPLTLVDPNGLSSQIPKNAHWVWIGEPIPKDFSRNINKFSHINADYTPTLWISKKTWSEKHRAALENLASRVIVKNIDEAFESADIRLTSAFERERSGSLHNYAAASDIARVVILYQQGGVYMDTDVISKFGMPLQQLTAHQGIMRTSRGNGIIAADKGNKHLNSAMKKMISAYEKNNDDMWKNKRTYISPMDRGLGDSAPKTSFRLRSTMQATGPDMWAEVLRNVIGHELPPVYFEPINASAVSYTKKPSDLRRDSI
ncbi:RHS repeat-associated core domain-containing protein [Pseudomonas sp. PB101]|jgi:insecticidal toxin complex protein TccC|uniref:RHS repeat-associated core domain-containing protein n=1 Tax=Pseudomonas sp. PB101 TaxID=2495428 RepID=UPI001365C5E9|nr:RHS repeat-associated core domain-containing protein [Pseudomonas sp. PB101]